MPDLTSDQAGVAITFFQPSTMDGTSWTNDINLSEQDVIYEYLTSKYCLDREGEDISKSWEKWSRDEESLKTIMFLERIGHLSFALFHNGESIIGKGNPLLLRGIWEAFYKGKNRIMLC